MNRDIFYLLNLKLIYKEFSPLQQRILPMKRLKFTGLFLAVFLLNSCANNVHQLTRIETHVNSPIDENIEMDADIQNFITPFKEKMDLEMNKVISYTPIDLLKDGFNTPLGNLNCDMIMEESNKIYQKRHGKKIDMCVLNWGGIRRSFPKGDLYLRSAYEMMPFDNMAWVVTMKGRSIEEMIQFLSESEFGHPIAGMTFKPFDISSLKINGEPYDPNREYTIVTNDFLLNGGDNMKFFSGAVSAEDLDMKLRDMIINYFSTHDTLKVNLDKRILK